jgi:outer membrane immunogenic protein
VVKQPTSIPSNHFGILKDHPMTISTLRSARRLFSCAAAVTPLLVTTPFAATSAIAADMTIKAPVVAPVPLWTGFYMGIHGGGGLGSSRLVDPDFTIVFDRVTMDTRGALAGAQIGANWQFDNIVVGGEIDASWSSIKGSRPGDPANIASGLAVAYHALATGTGRIGYASGNVLSYVKAGVAWANIDFQSFTGLAVAPIDVNHQRTGLTAGAGVEYALTNELSARVEYDYLYFGPASIALGTKRSPSSVDHQLHLLKLGVNYRFNGAPIVARY